MIKMHVITMLIFLISITSVQSQVSINSDGSDAAASAMLDVVSTSKGMLVPRMTTSQRTSISSPANGLLVFDETTTSFWFYETGGAAWVELVTGSSAVTSIDDLSDAASDEYSVFIGNYSGQNDDGTANANTAVGLHAARENTTGGYNTGIGNGALVFNSTGNSNTAIGYAAGRGSSGQSKSGGVFIGSLAGSDETNDNKLYIENSSSSSPLIGGDFASNYVDINGDLNVNGSIKITGGGPGLNKLLTSDANGNATWENASIPTTMGINDLTDGIYDGSNIFLGINSGNATTTGTSNYCLGYESLPNLTTGSTNCAFGYRSLNQNTEGKQNTAYGNQALYHNTTGDGNTAIGLSSLFYNTTGIKNVSIGMLSLLNNDTGSQNTSIGTYAGYNNDNSGNVFIGFSAGYNELGQSKLYIENSASTTPLIGGDFIANEVYINGTIKITGGSPGIGKFLTSDADGLASWEDGSALSIGIDNLTDGIYDGSNIFLGVNSGNATTTGTHNMGFGYECLKNVTTGFTNYAFGYRSLYSNTEGKQNTALGNQALLFNTTGDANIAIGLSSLYNNISGNNNVSIGMQSLASNETGSQNTSIGAYSGTSNNNSGNVFLGYMAGISETNSNKLYIENSNSSSPLIGGDFAANYIDINGDLNVNGSIKITGGTPGSNQVLTSDASGNATWETTGVPSAMAIDDLTDAASDGGSIFFGNDAGYFDDGANFNIGIGYSALRSTTSGVQNTGLGYHSLLYNQTGNSNTAVGFSAGRGTGLHSKSGGVFIGYWAGAFEMNSNKLYIENSSSSTPLIGGDFSADEVYINGTIKITGGTPGLNKVLTSDASGNATWEATGVPSTMAINDLTDGKSGGDSFFLGTNAGASDDGTSNLNTAVGHDALRLNTGSKNTAIGYQAGEASTTHVNTTTIGYNSVVSSSNTIKLGNSSILAIGGYAGWSDLSDKRFKNQIKENVAGLDFIMKLRPITYHLDVTKLDKFLGVEEENPDMKSKRAKEAVQQSGFIAQEVEQAAKDLNYDFSGVKKPQNDKDHYSIAYAEFVVPLVKAVQEQQAQIEAQQAMIEQMQLELENLKKQSE